MMAVDRSRRKDDIESDETAVPLLTINGASRSRLELTSEKLVLRLLLAICRVVQPPVRVQGLNHYQYPVTSQIKSSTGKESILLPR